MKPLMRFFALILLLTPSLGACSTGDIFGPDGGANLPLKQINVAYDPNKAGLFEDLLSVYNNRASVKVTGVELEIPDMLDAVSNGELVAVSPDSSVWLEGIDKAWRQANPDAPSIIGTTIRYGATPVVIATWRGREGELGAGKGGGWATLLQRASQDPGYRWSHGSPRASASGLLAVTAEFYAGAKKSFGLTKADADRQEVRSYVAQIEKTIARYGGESDAALVDYLLKEGESALSATVMPEASVFDFNQRSRGAKLYAIQPAEGTLMLDHPLVLLETADLTPDQRRAFLDFARFLGGSDGQAIVAKHGYRPVDLAYDMQKSPLASAGLSTLQPQLLQMPSAGILAYLQGAWASGLKRRTNIILVMDVSGSMEGDKLGRAKDALVSFLRQVPSDDERIGLVTFASNYQEMVPLGRLGDNRQQLVNAADQLNAGGNTAFFYAVWRAYLSLSQRNDPERINVVVA
ncbi:MAG: VWA domain-containing protein, partial [Dehalococcoidia bacterium]|nr:VWA domain-containing protein [Dehalococcoidia bacterium]